MALVVLFFWGNGQSLPVVIGTGALTLIGILGNVSSAVRHADILVHRLGEPHGSLVLSLSVVILEVGLVFTLVATGDAAPTLTRDALYPIIVVVTGGLAGSSLLLGGRKFATQYTGLFGIKQYLITLFPLTIIVLVFPMALPGANFTIAQTLLVALIPAAMYDVFLLIQTEMHQSLFIYEYEDEGDDNNSHHSKPSAHSNMWYAAWLIIHLIAVIAIAKINASSLETLLIELNTLVAFAGFPVALLILSPKRLGALEAILSNQV